MVAKVLNKAKWVLLAIAGCFTVAFLAQEIMALGGIILSFSERISLDMQDKNYLLIAKIAGLGFRDNVPVYYIVDCFYQLYGNLKVLFPAVICVLGFVAVMMIEKGKKAEEQEGDNQKSEKMKKLIQSMLMIVGIVCLAYFVLDVLFVLIVEVMEIIEELNGKILLGAYDNEFFYVVAWLTQSLLPRLFQAIPVLLLGVLTGGSVLFFLKKKKAVSIETQETDNQPEQEVAVSEEKVEEKAE